MYNHIEAYKDGILAILNVSTNDSGAYLTIAKLEEMIDIISKWNNHEGIGAIVLHSTFEDVFCYGSTTEIIENEQQYFTFRQLLMQLCSTIEESDKIFIALVNGKVCGSGLDVVLACDLRFSTLNGSFKLHTQLYNAVGSINRLTKLVGQSMALHFVLEEALITGKQAYDIGIVTKLLDEEHMWAELFKFADKISAQNLENVFLLKKLTKPDFIVDKKIFMLLEQLFKK